MDPRKQALYGRLVLLFWANLYLLIDQWIPWIGYSGLIPGSAAQPGWITLWIIGDDLANMAYGLHGPDYLIVIWTLMLIGLVFGPTILCIWFTVKTWRQSQALPESAEAATDPEGDEK